MKNVRTRRAGSPDSRSHSAASTRSIVDLEREIAALRARLAAVEGDGEDGSTRARLAAIVESSDDAIVGKTLDGVITSWNKGAEKLFGYDAGEAVGQPITMLIPKERLQEETEILQRIRRGDMVDHFETVRCRKGGAHIDVSVTVSPIRDYRGQIVGASKIARDISERKAAERVQREAERNRSEFLALLAHELRNPLAPIRNSLDVLQRSRRGGAATRAAGPDDSLDTAQAVLERQVGQLVRLVDDLLDAGRISRGKLELRVESVDLCQVARDAAAAAQPLFNRLGQTFTIDIPDTPVWLSADAARLMQVIGNLLSNASKFTPRGGQVWLRVGVGQRDGDASPEALIRVRDTGIGMTPDQLERAFELFLQFDRSLERSSSGLGIGLALVRTLTEMHGGSVTAESAGPNQGCEFFVRLPTIDAAMVHAPAPIPDAPWAGSCSVLIVDDNRDAAQMLSTLLELDGYVTHVVHDGLAAVESTATIKPDVVLLDIGLPILNGYEAAERIRRLDLGMRPAIIALTGWGQDEDRRRGEAAGFDAHLVKPVDERTLRQLLADINTQR